MTRVLLSALALLVFASTAAAQSGRGIRPETLENGGVIGVLIAKDIGGQRWALRLGLEGDTLGRISGVVTDPNASATTDPQFVQCIVVDVEGSPNDPDNEVFIFDCQVGPRCASRTPGSCAGWFNVSGVRLPGSFLLPPR